MFRDFRSMNVFVLVAVLLLLAACGGADTSATSTPTVQSGTVAASTPGVGPIVAVTPTADAGTTPAQQTITLADRTLMLGQVSRSPGASASSTAVSITITVTDTTAMAIQNQSSFYQLVGAEGDAFGVQSSVTPGFYGTIAAKQWHKGTITFQVPTGASQGLQLLYRPEKATETTLIPLPK
ncbi:MAG TPA: hypothetical protein VGT44_05410 [Ktedonobacteraceae bacterium]|nr:hypothetical protein [Ktedonobacteraceae bacterium]